MILKKGLKFTGSPQSFRGSVEVLDILEGSNRLDVRLTLPSAGATVVWEESWDLQHTLWGFDSGDYIETPPTAEGESKPRETRDWADLSLAEKELRSLIFAVESRHKRHPNHPFPMGEEYLNAKLADAKKTAEELGIPLAGTGFFKPLN